jgi:stage II sporulation protein P
VLIVNTHPYEGYHDGSAWYDPTQGGLAQTDSPNAPDGVVALSVALTRALRDRGVTVIHLRVPTTPEESSADLYDRTEAMIRYYCRLYPDIGLILDLRRSAELTETGEILRTEGIVNGTPAAQLRITVNGGRDSKALGYDLAVALALREGLWEEFPAISRPVRVRGGSGLASDLLDLRIVTLEMGAAGNTYAEAVGLVPPLARVLDEILRNFG